MVAVRELVGTVAVRLRNRRPVNSSRSQAVGAASVNDPWDVAPLKNSAVMVPMSSSAALPPIQAESWNTCVPASMLAVLAVGSVTVWASVPEVSVVVPKKYVPGEAAA